MRNDVGFVYLLIDTSKEFDGHYLAKYGFTRAKDIKMRTYRAQKRSGATFDIKIGVKVKKPAKVETEIKWGWRDPNYILYFGGSEFVGIKVEDIEHAIKEFERLANGKLGVDKAAQRNRKSLAVGL